MDKLVEKMKSKISDSGVEAFWSKLPVVRDYKEKELRREADKRVRRQLADALEEVRGRLSMLQSNMLSVAGGLSWMDDMEGAVGKLQLLITRVRTAAYGYAPLFDADKVRELELERLIRFDRALWAEVPDLQKKVGALQDAIREQGNIRSAFDALMAEITRLNDLFQKRKQAIQGEDIPGPELPAELSKDLTPPAAEATVTLPEKESEAAPPEAVPTAKSVVSDLIADDPLAATNSEAPAGGSSDTSADNPSSTGTPKGQD